MAEALDFSSFPADPEARSAKVAEATAAGTRVNFGWVPRPELTAPQKKAFDAIHAAMPRFGIRGRFTASERRYALWQAAVKLRGKHLPYFWQQTGSCVGAGGGNLLMTGMCVEIVLKGEPEEFRVPWWPFTYGKSRQRGGMRGQGEGSFEGAYKEAITRDGIFEIDPAGGPDLPDYKEQGGWLVQPASTEMKWSDGARIDPVWAPFGLKHLYKTGAPCRSADDVAEALMNGYPVAQASMFGFRAMTPRPVGDPPVRLVEWDGEWAHKTWFDEVWDHPTLGLIFRWGNNWGPTAHGSPTGDEPPGGVYMRKKTVDEICRSRDSEVIAYSAFDGFPARELNWSAF